MKSAENITTVTRTISPADIARP